MRRGWADGPGEVAQDRQLGPAIGPYIHQSYILELCWKNVRGFDWDDANVAHILRHAVTPCEVEETTGGRCFIIPTKTIKRERRWKLFGKTAIGRYLVVVFTIRQKLFRTVTAYEMDAAERNNYAPQID